MEWFKLALIGFKNLLATAIDKKDRGLFFVYFLGIVGMAGVIVQARGFETNIDKNKGNIKKNTKDINLLKGMASNTTTSMAVMQNDLSHIKKKQDEFSAQQSENTKILRNIEGAITERRHLEINSITR